MPKTIYDTKLYRLGNKLKKIVAIRWLHSRLFKSCFCHLAYRNTKKPIKSLKTNKNTWYAHFKIGLPAMKCKKWLKSSKMVVFLMCATHSEARKGDICQFTLNSANNRIIYTLYFSVINNIWHALFSVVFTVRYTPHFFAIKPFNLSLI